MILAHLTWPEIEALDRNIPVLIPTGAIEQHGAHLPLITDSLVVTRVAEAVEKALPGDVLVTPTIWHGASHHHLPFAGTLSATMGTYQTTLTDVVEAMVGHGFHKFLVINGHGGNLDSNKVTLRALKAARPNLFLAHATYIDFWPQALLDECLTGRIKGIRHACEAETSLMMHLAPELVRADKLRDDGLEPDGGFLGVIANFDEVTENGSFGEATRGTAATGQRLFDSAVAGATEWVRQARAGVSFVSL